jgi:hypothetical protein
VDQVGKSLLVEPSDGFLACHEVIESPRATLCREATSVAGEAKDLLVNTSD